MTFTVDILLLALFALIIYNSTKKGFLIGILGIAVWFVSFFIALSFSEQLAEWLYDEVLRERVLEELSKRLTTEGDAQPIAEMAASVIRELPQYAVRTAQTLGIDVGAIMRSIESADISAESTIAELAEKVAQPILTAALKALSFVVILVVSSSILKIVAHQINVVTKIPVLKQANKALGAVLGVVRGVIVVSIICVLLNIFANMSGSEGLVRAVDESKLVAAVVDMGIQL